MVLTEPQLDLGSGFSRLKSPYKRVLLKLSGEVLAGGQGFGVDNPVVSRVAAEIVDLRNNLGIDVAVVVGGGNMWRGDEHPEMERAQADYAGMLATVINAIALQDALEKLEQASRIVSAIEINKVCEPYIRRRAMRHMEKGRVVICAGGTGNPFFTTDTTAALRAVELEVDVLAMGKSLPSEIEGGVYNMDPRTNDDAQKLYRPTHSEVLALSDRIMDGTAITLAEDNDLPILVFHGARDGELMNVLCDPSRGSLIHTPLAA